MSELPQVGDRVRWTSPFDAALWADGRVTCIHDNVLSPSCGPPETCVILIGQVSPAWTSDRPPTGSMVVALRHVRRIPRSETARERAIAGRCLEWKCNGELEPERDGNRRCTRCGFAWFAEVVAGAAGEQEVQPQSQPAPVLYNGLTAEQCLERLEGRIATGDTMRLNPQAAMAILDTPALTLTPAQLSAARALWSARLRTLVAASTAADRQRQTTVTYCELDADD